MRDIKANIEVIEADGLHIGVIDRMEARRIRLAEKDGRDRSDTGRDRFSNPSLVARPDTITPTDISMMSRCIELSKQASSKGEFPFAALIVKGGKVISEALNEVNGQSDITRHAELPCYFQGSAGSRKSQACRLHNLQHHRALSDVQLSDPGGKAWPVGVRNGFPADGRV